LLRRDLRRVRLRSLLRSEVRRIGGEVESSWLATISPVGSRERLDVDLGVGRTRLFSGTSLEGTAVDLSGKSTW
jgi:hypothetical protein